MVWVRIFPLNADELASLNSNWRFHAGTTEASSPDLAAWRRVGFDDSKWEDLPAPFWYGDAQPAPGTELPGMRYNYQCAFLRQAAKSGLEASVVPA